MNFAKTGGPILKVYKFYYTFCWRRCLWG